MLSMFSGGYQHSPPSPTSSRQSLGGTAQLTHPSPPAPPLGAWSSSVLLPYALLVAAVVLLLCTLVRRPLMKAGIQSRRAVKTASTRAAMLQDAARRARRRAGAADDGLSLAKNEEVPGSIDDDDL